MTEAQGDKVIALLEGILYALTGPEEPPPCAHPEEQRINMTSMSEVEWICAACKFHYGPVKKEKKSDAAIPQSPVGA